MALARGRVRWHATVVWQRTTWARCCSGCCVCSRSIRVDRVRVKGVGVQLMGRVGRGVTGVMGVGVGVAVAVGVAVGVGVGVGVVLGGVCVRGAGRTYAGLVCWRALWGCASSCVPTR